MSLDLNGGLQSKDTLTGTLSEKVSISGDLSQKSSLSGSLSDDPINRVKSYTSLTNRPSINAIELIGNKELKDLGIQEQGNYILEENIEPISNLELEALLR